MKFPIPTFLPPVRRMMMGEGIPLFFLDWNILLHLLIILSAVYKYIYI